MSTDDHADHKAVLRGSALPSVAVLYGPGRADESDTRTIRRWVEVLIHAEEIDHLWIADHLDAPNPPALQIHRASAIRIDPSHPRYRDPTPLLRTGSSFLFCPIGLRLSRSVWDELRTDNNTDVDWIMVAPSASERTLPGVVLLSDWVREVTTDRRPPRSAGTTPGLMHLRERTLRKLPPSRGRKRSLEALISALIDRPGVKLRPAWVRDHGWEWSGPSP